MSTEIDRLTPKSRRCSELDVEAAHRHLIRGEWKVAEIVCLDGRLAVVIRRPDYPHRFALTRREIEVTRHVSEGRSDKWIAYELGVTRTTVATHLRNAMAKLGIEHRTHVALLRLFFGATSFSPTDVRITEWGAGFVSLVLPRWARLFADLTDAEASVARLAVVGCSNREIAEQRSVSQRTVANQLSEVYRKLGVNSRAELAADVAG